MAQIPVGARVRQMQHVREIVRIVFNALIYMNTTDALIERDATTAAANKERASVQKQLDRLKNPNKGKGRRLSRKLDGIPKDNVVWIGRDVPEAPSGQWTKGHWWPRRDTIKRRIAEAAASMTDAMDDMEVDRKALQDASHVDRIAEAIRRLDVSKKKVDGMQEHLDRLRGDLDGKRRWVRPYRRVKSDEQRQSRTYMLKLPIEGSS